MQQDTPTTPFCFCTVPVGTPIPFSTLCFPTCFSARRALRYSKFYIILPDDIGHGESSKPSDGLRMRFPHYDYDDMVTSQHAMLVDGLHVDHLRLILGTSMGCMQSFVWGETYPHFSDALAPSPACRSSWPGATACGATWRCR